MAEARRPPEKPSFDTTRVASPTSPRCIAVPYLVGLSQTVRQRVNGLVAPPSWVEVIYVITLYEVSRDLNLNLSSVGGRALKLTDYYRAEARLYLPERGKTDARPTEAEARPSPLENCHEAASSRGRCLEDSIPGLQCL